MNKRKRIIVSSIIISIIVISGLVIYELTKSNSPTILNTREPQHLCAIFDRTWNTDTNTCDYMNELECGFILGEWEECKSTSNCISTCTFEDSILESQP